MRHIVKLGKLIAMCLLFLAQSSLKANDPWPQFLGPGGLADAGNHDIPLKFGPEKNLLWKSTIPKGNSSPIIWNNHLFLSGYKESTRVMMAVDRRDGTVLWERFVESRERESFTHRLSGPAESTPCTDGERVYFYFGNYGLIALNLDGSLAWEKILDKPRTGMGTGTSPIVHDGLLILNRDGTSDPCILALESKSGNEVWKHPRIGYTSSHATPFIWRNKLQTELVVAGTRSLVSLDPESGKLIWKVEDTNAFPCTSPTANEDMLFFASWSANNANSREKLEAHFDDALAITDEEMNDPKLFFSRFDKDDDGSLTLNELPESRAKDVFKWLDSNNNEKWEQDEFSLLTRPGGRGRNLMLAILPGGRNVLNDTDHISWESRRHLPYVATPLVSENRVFLIKSMGVVSCLNTETGSPFFLGKRTGVKGEYFSTPIKAGNKIILCSNNGTVMILRDGENFEILASTTIEEEIIATPAVVDNTIYLRSENSLWAFTKLRDT